MTKFKLGDKVIGNAHANRYSITTEGIVGEVVKVSNQEIAIRIIGYVPPVGKFNHSTIGEEGQYYGLLNPNAFDLFAPQTNKSALELIKLKN